jgi:hypothetical protein
VDHAATAYGSESSAVLLGVDIIARSEDAAFRGEVYQAARDVAVLRQQAVERAETLGRVIANLMETHGRDLMSTLSEPSLREAITSMDRSYLRMAESHEYRRLQATVLEYLQQADLFVGEVNARMDFGTHCRALSVPDVAEKMAAVAARV